MCSIFVLEQKRKLFQILMKITTNILNPNSKFRKKINSFDLGGNFVTGKCRLYSLIDMFHEEYILNKDRVPKLQWEYLNDDIKYIDSKIQSMEVLMRNQDEDKRVLTKLQEVWEATKELL